MYGYVVPDKTTLRASDFVLYRAFYCGMCCQTGKLYGQLPRFTTNYDFAFLSCLLFDYSKNDLVIEEHKCVLNPVKKKAVVMPNDLLFRLAAANIMLAYKKADDGVIDGDGVKYRVIRSALKKAVKKAKAACPEIFDRIAKGYDEQRKIEKNNIASLDRAADPFASLMSDLVGLILNNKIDDKMRVLCYNIGKFAYLCDGLDDIESDIKAKRYNPFAACFNVNKKNFSGREAFIKDNLEKIKFALYSVANRAATTVKEIKFTQCESLIYNIVLNGLPKKIDELLNSKKQLPPPKL